MATENIDIRVSEDGSRVVRRRLDDIADGADRAYGAAERLNSILRMVGKYLAVTEVMRWADAWSVASSSIKIATNNSYEFVQVQSSLFKIAQRSRQEFGALTELYAAVARQSENLQTSQKGLLLYTENIAKALAIQHTSMTAARGPLLQLGQAMASGTIRAQEFNSIMLGLPYVMKVVADNFKGGAVSVMQLRQMMLQGKLESKEFFEAFQRGTSQINKDFEKTQVTFSQAFTIFKNELVKFTGTMDSTTGAAAKFATVLKFVAENLTLLASAAAAVAIGAKFGPMIASVVAWRAATVEASNAVSAANLQVAASNQAAALAAMESARASVGKTQAELANATATQAAIVVSREAAIATLAKANSDIVAARASIQAATNAGALSYALAVKRDAEVALTAAEVRRSAALSELAILGQQQARVTVIQTEATAAHAAAVRALSVAQGIGAEAAAAYGIAQTGAAAAVGRVGFAAGATAVATRVFSGAVALMGGPIGLAITALAGLALWLFNVKSNADDAKAAIDAVNRVNAAKTGGAGVRQSDAERIQSALSKAQKEKDDAEDRIEKFRENLASKRSRGYNREADELQAKFGKSFQDDLDKATEKVNTFSKAMEDAKDLSVETGGAAGKAARELGNARAAWEQTNKGVKTATGIQETYTDELEKSRKAHKTYIEQLKTSNTGGVHDAEIARANKLQAESEISMAKERDAALKRLRNQGAETVKQVQLEVDERMSLISTGLDNELSVRNKAYESDKRMLDAKHQNGILSEAQFMAQNLQMVERYESEEKAIIAKASADQKAAYDERRAYIQNKLSGQRETDELKKLDADYARFVDSVNAKLSKLDISAYERQSTAIYKLSGEIAKVAKQDDQYWRQASANADKDEAVANAKRNLAFATQEQQAAYEAYMRTGEQHNAQLSRLEEAYNNARQEADDFSASIDWREAGANTLAILEAMNDKADDFGARLAAAYGKLDELRNRAAAAAAESVRNREFNKNVNNIADAIETAIFDGGKQGGKKFTDWLKNYFLRNPIRVILQGTVSTIAGAIGLGAGGAGGAGGTGSTPGIGGLLNAGSSIYSALTNGISGSISSAFSSFATSDIGARIGLSTATDFGTGYAANIPTPAASNIGAGLGMLGNGLAGYGISSMISGGYSTGGNTVNAIAGIASAIPGIGPIAGVIGGLTNRAFGRKLKDVGIEGTLGGAEGFEGQQYKFYKGGWFRSDKTKYQDLDPTVSGGLAQSFKAIQAQVGTFATVLGLETDKIASFTTSFKVSTKGLDEAGIAQAFQEALAKGSNELAQQVLGTWTTTTREVTETLAGGMGDWGDGTMQTVTRTIEETTYAASEYAKAGEEAIDTLRRLATSLIAVNTMADAMGQDLKLSGLAGAAAASKIAEAFGGLEAYAQTMGSYFQNYYSDAEQRAAVARQASRALADVGLDFSADKLLAATRPQIRAFVEGVAAQFGQDSAQYVAAVQQANALSAILEPLQSAIHTTSDAMDAMDAAFASLESAIGREIEELEKAKSAIESSLQKITDIFNILDSAFKQLMGSIESTVEQSYEQSRAYLAAAAANPGRALDKDQLENAIAGINNGLSADNFSTKLDYDRERLTIAGQYSKLRDVAKQQVTVEEMALEAINIQIDKLNSMLKVAEMQLDQLRGIDDSVISVEQAILNFQKAWLAEQIATNGGDTPGTGGGRPGGGGGGGGLSFSAGGGSAQRVNYGADEALSSFDKFTAWYNGLRYTANVGAMTDGGYEVPDWLRLTGMADDGTDKELFAQYQFFKNNPQYAADYQQIMTTGRSSYGTDGSTLVRSDLSKMPADAAAYYKENTAALLMAEGFLLDPVLAYQLYRDGPERFGLDRRTTSFTEWLRSNQWTEEGLVAGNNAHRYAGMDYANYNLTKWDTSTGTLVGRDGIIYTPDGRPVGRASPNQMQELYGNSNSRLYNQTTSGGTSAQDYYTGLRQKYDQDIADGKSAQYLADSIRNSGASMQDIATAYGITVDVLKENLRLGGATDIPAFAAGGYHSGGLRVVGERGWELEATGPARIWNQSQLGKALAMGMSDTEPEEDGFAIEMANVAQELDNIRRTSYAFGRSQTVELRQIVKLMKKNDAIGTPPVRAEEDNL